MHGSLTETIDDPFREAARGIANLFELPFNEAWGGIEIANRDGYLVLVLRMFVNWRVIESDGTWSYRRAWCYRNATTAVLSARAWVESFEYEPDGWIKSVHDGRVGPTYER